VEKNGAWAIANGTVVGFTPLPYITPGSGWSVAGGADLNADGYDDVLLKNVNGENGAWAVFNGSVFGFTPLPFTA
jgi:hypothetical protein